jgi:glycosyltransferase involved in cell wall biosynthesis
MSWQLKNERFLGMNTIRLSDKTPTISVLLPVYNAERYLSAAVESVLNQTFDDFELLAFDDGSSDRSLSILREFAAKDSRVRVLSRENRGYLVALNEMIAIARGRYLARMDADDICLPQRFEKQVAYLEAHSECVVVGSKCLAIDPEGMPIREFVGHFVHDEIDAALMSGEGQSRMCHPSVMMRRVAIVQVGCYREEYYFAEDVDLLLRLAEIGKLANIPEILILYRLHLKSVCHAHSEEQRNRGRQAVKMAWKRRGIDGVGGMADSTEKLETHADAHRRWAWWALSAGNLTTARKHAVKALAKDPFNIENLRVVACAIRGR